MISHDQEFELYHYGESLCSQKARIGMAEKNLEYKSHHIVICDVAEECQNLSEEYLEVNPRGVVPTLVHNGRQVFNAHHIIRYVDDNYPDNGQKLWPSDPARIKIAQKWFEDGMLNEDARYGSNFGMSIPILTHPFLAHTLNKQSLDLVVEKYRNHPIKSRGQRFTELRRHGKAFPKEVFTEALTNVCRGLSDINKLLEKYGGPWLLGEFTLPDITMMACFHRLSDINLGVLLSHEKVPLVWDYWARLQERPSFQEAVLNWYDYKNWRPSIIEVYGNRISPLYDESILIMDALSDSVF